MSDEWPEIQATVWRRLSTSINAPDRWSEPFEHVPVFRQRQRSWKGQRVIDDAANRDDRS